MFFPQTQTKNVSFMRSKSNITAYRTAGRHSICNGKIQSRIPTANDRLWETLGAIPRLDELIMPQFPVQQPFHFYEIRPYTTTYNSGSPIIYTPSHTTGDFISRPYDGGITISGPDNDGDNITYTLSSTVLPNADGRVYPMGDIT